MKRTVISSLLFIGSMLYFSSCEKHNVIAKPNYAIGVIVAYQKATGDISSDNFINYNYTVDGMQYDNSYNDQQFGPKWEVPSGSYKKGSMYMVEYDGGCTSGDKCNDQTASRMLFNYPVRDSTDYNNYVTQFATTPPTP